MPTITVTFFDDKSANALKAFDLDWEEIVERLRHPKEYPEKNQCPLIKLATFGNLRSLKNSLRHDANMLSITGVEGDYDGGKISIEEAAMMLSESSIDAVLYTSPSHTPEKPRWRVLCPLSKPCAPSERRKLLGRVNGALSGILGSESFTQSQSFYIGKVNGCEYQVQQVRGIFLDQLDHLDESAVFPQKQESKLDRLQALRSDDPIIQILGEKNLIKSHRADGAVNIICPFVHYHTSVDESDSATVYFPANTGGYAKWHIKCLHGHCVNRSHNEYEQELGIVSDGNKKIQEEKHVPQYIKWDELNGKEPPARKWLVDGWLPYTPCLLSGAGSVGKSYLAQAIATSVAVGHNYIGEVNEPRRALVWACEDDEAELWRRQTAICEHFGIEISALGNLIIESRVGLDNTLVASNMGLIMGTSMLTQLTEQIGDLRPSIVSLDNLSQLFGGNENSRHDVTFFMNSLIGIANKTNVEFCVLLLGHISRAHGSEFSGSSAWENSVRMRLFFGYDLPDDKEPEKDQEKDQDERYLSKRKTNYSKKDFRKFHWQQKTHTGLFVPENAAPEYSPLIHAINAKRCEEAIINGLKKMAEKGFYANASRSSQDYLPKFMLKWELIKIGEFSTSEVIKSMTSLVMSGKIAQVSVGNYGNRATKLGFKVL